MLIRMPEGWALPTAIGVGGVAVTAAAAWGVSRLLDRGQCPTPGATEGVVAGIRYLERIRGGADPTDPLPMVVLFHSKGATPEGFAGMLGGIGPARLIVPQGLYRSGSGYKWWTEGVVAATKPQNYAEAVGQWQATADAIDRFMRVITRCRPTVGDPIVTGSSQGGELALLMASESPRRVRGAVAVSSYLLEPFWNDGMAPTIMIHGTGDTTVPYGWASAYAEALAHDGAALRFESFPSSGHAVTKDMGSAWIAAVRDFVAPL